MKKKMNVWTVLILIGGIGIIAFSGCKKGDGFIDEKLHNKVEVKSKLPNNFVEVKTFYAMILGVDSAMINYNETNKTFFIKNTKVEESFELIKESYLIYKKHNLK